MSVTAPRKLPDRTTSHRLIAGMAGVVCALSLACSAQEGDELEASSSRAALIGGTLSQRDAVVFIHASHADGSFDNCSGTLLSPRVVLTAKHCVARVQPGKVVCTGAGTLKEDGQGGGLFGAKVPPAELEIFAATTPTDSATARAIATYTSESGDSCHDDIAAIVLDTPIELDAYPPLRSSRPTQVGETVRLVGYGVNGREPIERHELADIRIIDVGRDEVPANPNATTPPRSFAVAGGTGCFGDSGGPALSMNSGVLVGTYSRISGDCLAPETRNTFMLAGSFLDVFEQAFQQVGEHPQLEPFAETVTEPQGSAGALAEEPTPPEPARHEALNCSLVGRPGSATAHGLAAWLLAALAAGFSRRRAFRGLFWGD